MHSRPTAFIVLATICFIIATFLSPQSASADFLGAPLRASNPVESLTFPAFDSATLIGDGAADSHNLDVSAVPAVRYLFYTLTADFVPGTPLAQSAWSNTIYMYIDDGAGNTYAPERTANYGSAQSADATTLIWTGISLQPYDGGDTLRVSVGDNFTDGSGPYNSSLENVTLTIYPAPLAEQSFASYNTGTLIGDGAAHSHALDVAALPTSQYQYFVLSADFVAGTPLAQSAWSETIYLIIDDGAGNQYYPQRRASFGGEQSTDPTTLYWTGMLIRPYTGGDPLYLNLGDDFTDGSGPYNSSLENVTFTLYPAQTPRRGFAPFDTGALIGDGAADETVLDTSAFPEVDYLFFTLSADFVAGTPLAQSAWSNTIYASFSGAGSAYFPETLATHGALQSTDATTLTWTGMFVRPYQAGDPLSLFLGDNFTDENGPYNSSLENVTLTLIAAATPPDTYAASDCSAIADPCYSDVSQAVQDVAVNGRVHVVDSLPAAIISINKDLSLLADPSGGVSGSGGSAALIVSDGTVLIEGLAIDAGASANAVAVGGGNVTLRGNSIDGGGAAAIVQSGGAVSAYANNLVNTGGVGVAGTVSAPKNWWGSAGDQPTGVGSADWAVRLGAAVDSAAFGSGGTVSLGDAQLTGPGPGTGVIVSFGRGAANTPFGVGVDPYDAQSCSDFYDFYSTGGAGWTVLLPVDTATAGCTANTLTPERAFMIADPDECSAADSSACWDLIPEGQISINGNNLEISGLTLSGTHIVAGDSSSGADPTAVRVKRFASAYWSASPAVSLLLAMAGLATAVLAAQVIKGNRKRSRRNLR